MNTAGISTGRKLKAGILTIGNEVLDGIIQDTNSNWMETELTKIGIEMRRVLTIRDEIDEIGIGLKFLSEECDVIITSGGLGPTHDDMTLSAIAIALGRPLEENRDALAIIKRQYQILFDRGIVKDPDMTDSRKKMAKIPQGSEPLDNTVGGAPGVKMEYQDSTIFCLPGVPSELKDIWNSSVQPWLEENNSSLYYEETVEFGVTDESVFAPFVNIVMHSHPSVWIKSMPKRYGTSHVLRVWVSSRGTDIEKIRSDVKSAISSLEKQSGMKATHAK
ncbi:MAG: competence/damage-inducible protein A [Candidatus Thorarchaeota archaeon]